MSLFSFLSFDFHSFLNTFLHLLSFRSFIFFDSPSRFLLTLCSSFSLSPLPSFCFSFSIDRIRSKEIVWIKHLTASSSSSSSWSSSAHFHPSPPSSHPRFITCYTHHLLKSHLIYPPLFPIHFICSPSLLPNSFLFSITSVLKLGCSEDFERVWESQECKRDLLKKKKQSGLQWMKLSRTRWNDWNTQLEHVFFFLHLVILYPTFYLHSSSIFNLILEDMKKLSSETSSHPIPALW